MDYLEQNFEIETLDGSIGKFVGKTKVVSGYMLKWEQAINQTVCCMVNQL